MIKWVSEPNMSVKTRSESSKTIQMYTNLIKTTSKYDLILPRSPMILINKCIKNNLAYSVKYNANSKNPDLVKKQNEKPLSKIKLLIFDEIEVFNSMSKIQGIKMLKKSLSF